GALAARQRAANMRLRREGHVHLGIARNDGLEVAEVTSKRQVLRIEDAAHQEAVVRLLLATAVNSNRRFSCGTVTRLGERKVFSLFTGPSSSTRSPAAMPFSSSG